MAAIPKHSKRAETINGGKHTTGEYTQKATVARLLLIAPSLSKLLSVKVFALNRNRSEGAKRTAEQAPNRRRSGN